MADETDGIEEALEGTVRMAVMAGARLGAEILRAREEGLRQQQVRDEAQARQLAERFEAEKGVAVAELSQVHRPDWWDRADAERIGQTYATATAWAPEVEEAARAERRMRDELQARYGIDLNHTDPRAVATEVEAWRQRLEEQRRAAATGQRSSETAERGEAAMLLSQAAQEDRSAEQSRADQRQTEAHAGAQANGVAGNPGLDPGQDREAARDLLERAEEDRQRARDSEARGDDWAGEAALHYDSAERRAADARALEQKGIDPEVVASRMRADTNVATPATLATAGAGRGSRAPKARKAVSRGAQIERPGVER